MIGRDGRRQYKGHAACGRFARRQLIAPIPGGRNSAHWLMGRRVHSRQCRIPHRTTPLAASLDPGMSVATAMRASAIVTELAPHQRADHGPADRQGKGVAVVQHSTSERCKGMPRIRGAMIAANGRNW